MEGKGLKALNVLLTNTYKYAITTKVLCQVFDAFVGSTLNYACEIWGFSKLREIERIHLQFCKSLLSVKSLTCNMGVYGELGRFPLYISRYTRIIKYWCKIVKRDTIIIQRLYGTIVRGQAITPPPPKGIYGIFLLCCLYNTKLKSSRLPPSNYC
jgi:hypothetical protein